METSPYGIGAMWAQGDVVTKGVAAMLLLMSLASWYVILTRSFRVWQHSRVARAVGPAFWDAPSIQQGLLTLGEDNPFAEVARAGLVAMEHHHRQHEVHLHDRLTVSDWITMSLRQAIDESLAKLQAGMAVLASVGSTAPFVGLFGTVWGIYHALVSIGASGQAGIDKVAGPVGEALIMTALGLAVAIPATFGYNALVRGNKSISGQLNKFGFDLHALFATGARTAGGDQAHELPEGRNEPRRVQRMAAGAA